MPLQRAGVPSEEGFCRLCAGLRKGSCERQLGEDKNNQVQHQLTTKIKEPLSQLCTHSSGRSSWRELGACLCHRLEEFPVTERLQGWAAPDEQIRCISSFFLSFPLQKELRSLLQSFLQPVHSSQPSPLLHGPTRSCHQRMQTVRKRRLSHLNASEHRGAPGNF